MSKQLTIETLNTEAAAVTREELIASIAKAGRHIIESLPWRKFEKEKPQDLQLILIKFAGFEIDIAVYDAERNRLTSGFRKDMRDWNLSWCPLPVTLETN